MARIKFAVDGKAVTINADPDMPLLYALRNDLKMTNPHFGCGLAQCGACTVHLEGEAVRSCVLPVSAAAGKKVTTLQGLGTPEKPHPLQTAFLDEQAGQCGYCLPGILVSAKALLDRNPTPSRQEIAQALDENICRCGSHIRILKAVERAAAAMRAGAGR